MDQFLQEAPVVQAFQNIPETKIQTVFTFTQYKNQMQKQSVKELNLNQLSILLVISPRVR